MDRDHRSNYDPNVTHLGRGESYRPGGLGGAPPYRAGPTRDRGREKWTLGRRDLERREDVDSYVPQHSRRPERARSRSPGGYRRRSRSPLYRSRDDEYSSRPRSPRRFSPRRGERVSSPARRRFRSPDGARAFSSPQKRTCDSIPQHARRASPAQKRERFVSPDGRPDRFHSSPRHTYRPSSRDMNRGGYHMRSRTPPRRYERGSVHDHDCWRRRSPSPKVTPSGPASGTTSRRSSPPLHPDRLGLARSRHHSPSEPPSRPYNSLTPRPFARPESPPRSERTQPGPQTARNFVDRTRAAPSPRRDHGNDESRPPTQPPSRPGGNRNGNFARPPPSGPARNHVEAPPMSPSAGPPGPSVSMSAHNRPNPSILAAPTRPRGAPPGRLDGPSRDSVAPPSRRGGYGDAPSRPASYDTHHGLHGSRAGFARGSQGRGESGFGRADYVYGRPEPGHGRGDTGYATRRPSFGREDGPPPFRMHNSNSSSMTYPRTQRFNTASQYLAAGEKIIPGGKLATCGIALEKEKRVRQLEEAAEKIREEIEEKQRAKRDSLKEWEVRQRESEREGLRSELAERHLEKLTEGEDGAGAAF